MRRELLLLGALCVFSQKGHAQLVWRSKKLVVPAKLEETKAHTHFDFKNVGSYPIKISEVKTSCGCTTAVLEKTLYQPGESGSIDTTMTIENKLGIQEKYINVNSDDPQAANEQLCFRVELPELLRVVPNFLYWKPNDFSAKTVEVTAPDNLPIDIQRVNFDDEKFAVAWKPQEKVGEYLFVITPRTSVDGQKATVTLITNYPQVHPRVFYIHMQVNKDL